MGTLWTWVLQDLLKLRWGPRRAASAPIAASARPTPASASASADTPAMPARSRTRSPRRDRLTFCVGRLLVEECLYTGSSPSYISLRPSPLRETNTQSDWLLALPLYSLLSATCARIFSKNFTYA